MEYTKIMYDDHEDENDDFADRKLPKIVREKIVMISWTELNNVFTKNKTTSCTEADKNTKICTHTSHTKCTITNGPIYN